MMATAHLRIIRDESAPAYDGTTRSGHRTMIDDDVVEEVLQQCGLAATGLYTYLERKANREGKCWPSIREMAEVAGCSERYITELINTKLVPAGFVLRHQKTNRFGRTLGVVYTLPFHQTPRNVGGEHPPEPRGEQGGEPESQTSSPKVDTGVDTGVAKSTGGDMAREQKAPSERKPRRNPDLPLPDDFTLTEARLAYAVAQGMDEGRARYQFERLRNWAADKQVTSRDWDARWRNWVLKDIRDNGRTTSDEDDPWVMSPSGTMKRRSELKQVAPPPPPPADWGVS